MQGQDTLVALGQTSGNAGSQRAPLRKLQTWPGNLPGPQSPKGVVLQEQDSSVAYSADVPAVRSAQLPSMWDLQVSVVVLFATAALLGICQLLAWTLLTWLDQQSIWPR